MRPMENNWIKCIDKEIGYVNIKYLLYLPLVCNKAIDVHTV